MINTPATDGSDLGSDRAAKHGDAPLTERWTQSPDPLCFPDSKLIKNFHPALDRIPCVRFMNPVPQSALFPTDELGVIGSAAAFLFLRLEKYLWIYETHTLHLTTSHGRITVRVLAGREKQSERERKGKTSSEERHVRLPHGINSNQEGNHGFVCSREQALMSDNPTDASSRS